MTAVTHPRLAPRRSASGGTWWSKAVLRAVEEAAYSEADLRRGRALARAGAVGRITVDDGSAVAAVDDGDDAMSVTVTVPVLDRASSETFVELVAAGAGRVGSLLAGSCPTRSSRTSRRQASSCCRTAASCGSACSCDAWLDPCPHALAVLTQVAWLIQADPFVLTHLRGSSREDVLRDLHALTSRGGESTVGGGARGPDRRLRGRAGRRRAGAACRRPAGAGPPASTTSSTAADEASDQAERAPRHVPQQLAHRPCRAAARCAGWS